MTLKAFGVSDDGRETMDGWLDLKSNELGAVAWAERVSNGGAERFIIMAKLRTTLRTSKYPKLILPERVLIIQILPNLGNLPPALPPPPPTLFSFYLFFFSVFCVVTFFFLSPFAYFVIK